MKRDKYPSRTIRLVGEAQRQTALAVLASVPLDSEKPLQVLVREEPKARFDVAHTVRAPR